MGPIVIECEERVSLLGGSEPPSPQEAISVHNLLPGPQMGLAGQVEEPRGEADQLAHTYQGPGGARVRRAMGPVGQGFEELGLFVP